MREGRIAPRQSPQQDVAPAARMVLDRCRRPCHHVTIPHRVSRGMPPKPATALPGEPEALCVVVGGAGVATTLQRDIPTHRAVC